MQTIEITTKWPYAPKGVALKEFRVNGLTFAQFAAAAKASAGAKNETAARMRQMRARMAVQIMAVGADGKQFRLSDEEISQIPAIYAVPLRDAMTLALFPEGAGEAKIVTEGDGYSTPIHIALGTPLKGAGDAAFEELEFKAGTIMDLEEVLSFDNNFEQTDALLGIAKPVTGTLLRLPDWAKEQLSLADGLFIMNKVRPLFCDAATSS